MNRRTAPKVLLLQLEFPTWAQARAWTYPACFGVGEGLRAAGAICTTLPLFANASLSPDRWLEQSRAAVDGQRFDQVWVWLVHAPLTVSILEWISGLAPVRVGIVMESLTYDEADYDWAGHLRGRMQTVAEQASVFTHVLVPDERDVEPLAQRAGVQSLWWPTMVPERFIVPSTSEPRFSTGVFHGHPYGPRRAWVENARLQAHMTFVGPGAPSTRYQIWFDQLQASAIRRWSSPAAMPAHQITDYVTMLQEVREGEFREWMAQLQQWAAIVNLPSLAKFYGGRVYEGMAAGRPVLTYHVPDHPFNNSLFAEGEEVLCFAPDDPESLHAGLERVLRDRNLAHRIAVNAQRKMRRYHTSERRLADTLRWIESGVRPDYGIQHSLEVLPIPQSAGHDQKTTVFVLTVDDPVFPACKAALEAQRGTEFRLDIIRNVSPFSAAAQKMITDCTTEFFIQVDEDMVLQPDAVASMEAVMQKAPDDVGMICFHLYDEDRGINIQGVKIYRTALLKGLSFRDRKASEMDLLEQMGQLGIKWILHPDVKGRHGTFYTPETIYRRYKTMYEKDIRQWNTLTSDVRRKAERFRESGDIIQLFALLGAAHGIISAPHAPDCEKDARRYGLIELDVFKRLFVSTPPTTQPYDADKTGIPVGNPPIPFAQVNWNRDHMQSVRPSLGHTSTTPVAPTTTEPIGCERSHTKNILIVTPFFWPSTGGVERVAEQLSMGLLRQGYQVDVATYPTIGRYLDNYKGVRIITLANFDQVVDDHRICILQVEKLLQSRRYAACLLLGAPSNALFYGALTTPFPAETKLFIQPTMNEETLDDLKQDDFLRPLFHKLARQAQAVVVLSEDGEDARFMKEQGVGPVYLPNGTMPVSPREDFRHKYGIAPHRFLILHVANLYPVKNHLGLLTELNRLPSDAQLVMIGRPTEETEYVRQVQSALSGRPDVLYVPGLDAEGIAAAMRAADVLVLASHSEASPLVVLEAMSCGLPWLATPGCGTVHEQAGGLVATLSSFHEVIMRLKEDGDLRRQLGELGRAHWAASFDWSHVLRGWIELLTTGQLTASFVTPEEVKQGMRNLRRHRALRDLTASEDVGHTAIASAATRPPHTTSEGSMDSDRFYVNLFVNAPIWSTPYPNADEAARWSKIASFLECILRRVRQHNPNKVLRILDVGCGRGWLTNLVSMYGSCEGVEPVSEVVAHARRLFPHLRFEAGTADQVLARPDFAPYDVVVCSEVLEHVPHGEKDLFLAQLAALLTPEGYVVLTTPRGEMWEQWKTIAPPNQPVEDWVTEGDLRKLFCRQGFAELGLERVYVEVPGLRYVPAPTPAELESMQLLPIYQVWACQRVKCNQPATFLRRPKVSVILPSYNRPDRLTEALQSVLRQSYQDFEIVVVNDGGTDVGATVAALNDGRIMYIQHDRNRGLAAARNTGLRAAKGKYVAYLDDDDRYLPNHLETLVKVLVGSECKVAYTDAWRVHEQSEGGQYFEVGRDLPYSYDFNPANLLVGNYFPVLCVMHERSCLDDVGGFDESLFAHEDWDLWIRMAMKFQFVHVKKITAEFTWRTDGSSMTSGTQQTYYRTTEIIYRKYRPYAERVPDVRAAQEQRLAELRAKTRPSHFDCSIIVPVWNGAELTRQCLTALACATTDVTFEVIVVDNGSTDGTPEVLASLAGDIRIIRNQENLGFAKACNQGARAATGNYLVFLNNDTIPQRGWLKALVNEVEAHTEVGIVGSKLLYPDGTVQHAGVVRDIEDRLPYHIYQKFSGDHPAVNRRREFQIVTAACMLTRRILFEELGGFDEGYVNGFEDADLCLKVRERGYQVVYQPRSVVVHLESQTPGRMTHENANAARFLDRWGTQWWAADEDRHFYIDGYNIKRIARNGQTDGNIVLREETRDGASWAHVAATQTSAMKKDWEAVRRELALVDEWPNDRFVLAWGATVAERLQEPVYRAQFLARYVALVDEPAKRLELIRMFLEQHNLSGAEEHLTILLAASPDHGEGLLLKGILCMQREQYEQAETAFAAAIREGAERRKCLMGMGMAAMGRAYTQGAWERFLEVLVEYPDDGEAIHWLLRAGTAQNRWQELGERLHVYTTRNPGDLAARFAFTSVLLRGEQIEAARRECDALCKVDPHYDGLGQLSQAIAGREAALAMEGASS
ncbi:MAG: glycosyltransferase [Nitrospira sp.]|nr:glycosyltransferase [Nitrospira sp.]